MGPNKASEYPKTKIMIIWSVKPNSPKNPSCQKDISFKTFAAIGFEESCSINPNPTTNDDSVSSNTNPIGVKKDFKMFLTDLVFNIFIVEKFGLV